MKPWLEKTWCIPPKADAEFVCRMEDVLELYRKPYDPKYPVLCMDEASKQLIAETRVPLPADSEFRTLHLNCEESFELPAPDGRRRACRLIGTELRPAPDA